MKTESIWLVLIEQNLYYVIQKMLEKLAQDTDLCVKTAGEGDTIIQELAEHQLGPTGSLLQQLKVTFTTSNSCFPYFLWLCKSGNVVDLHKTSIRSNSKWELGDYREGHVFPELQAGSSGKGWQGRVALSTCSALAPPNVFFPHLGTLFHWYWCNSLLLTVLWRVVL